MVRHEALRTLFPERDGEPYALVRPAADVAVEIPVIDVGADGGTAGNHDGFDLTTALPVRFSLRRLSADEHVLFVVVHPVAGAGWAQGALTDDLLTAYESRRHGREPQWKADIARHDDPADREFWDRNLAGLADEITLPSPAPPSVLTYASARIPVRVDAETHAAVLALADAADATAEDVLRATFATVLSGMGAGTDLPLGATVHGLRDGAVPSSNSLVVRVDTAGQPSLRDLVRRVGAAARDAKAHQGLPFERLVEMLAPGLTTVRHPVYQAAVYLRPQSVAAVEAGGLTVRAEPFDPGSTGSTSAWTSPRRPAGTGWSVSSPTAPISSTRTPRRHWPGGGTAC
ncbi:condensation domain-containing protein [Micromonospora sp. M12]